jgi:hypothetical protein
MQGQMRNPAVLCVEDLHTEVPMDERKISNGPNERPRDETIAGTGPGIPDDALAPGETLPNPPADEEVARIARKLGAPVERGEAES